MNDDNAISRLNKHLFFSSPTQRLNPVYLGSMVGIRVAIILLLVPFCLFYLVDLFGVDASIYLHELSFVFVIASLIISVFLFFFFDGLSLALVFLFPYLLFIGGRIFVLAATGDSHVFDFSYFKQYLPNPDEAAKLVIQSLVAYLGVALGYVSQFVSARSGHLRSGLLHDTRAIKTAAGIMIIVASSLLFIELGRQLATVRSEGYAALYLAQTEVYAGSLISVGLTLLTIALCFCFAANTPKLYRMALAVYASVVVFFAVLGQRGPIMSFVLFVTALLMRRMSAREKTTRLMVTIFSLVLVVTLFSLFSLREHVTEDTYGNALLDFLFEQGGSLSIYGMSLGVEDYPVTALIQNFVPGLGAFSSLAGYPLTTEELSFGAYLSRSLNQDLFYAGHGLGWSVLGDAVLYFGNGYPVFFFIVGLLIGVVDKHKSFGGFWAGVWVLLALKLSFVPRASLGSVVVLMEYYIIAWIIVAWFSQKCVRR